MSIAEKLNTIADNTPKVYEAGYKDGASSVVDIASLCEYITFANLNVFSKPEVTLNLLNITSMQDMFMVQNNDEPNKTVEKITINCSKPITSCSRMFYAQSTVADKTLKQVTLNADTSKTTTFVQMFINSTALEIIDGSPLDFSSATTVNGMFSYCGMLKEVRFAKGTLKQSIIFVNSNLLTDETIQSIIDGLADLTGGTAQTLTLHATVGGKLTDEQKASITAKNWTLVY